MLFAVCLPCHLQHCDRDCDRVAAFPCCTLPPPSASPPLCLSLSLRLNLVVVWQSTTEGVPKVQPVFISIDPNRDTPAKIKEYLTDFYPGMIGLTGTDAQIRTLAKAYRIYYSKPIEDDSLDYLVDHTIVM